MSHPTSGGGPVIPTTPSALDLIYRDFALNAEQRETRHGEPTGAQGHHLRMAKNMADDALATAFVESVATYGEYDNRDQPFFDTRDPLIEAEHRPTVDDDLKTSSIAWWLEQDPQLRDATGADLRWTYAARELVPLRTAGQDPARSALSRASRRLDLLLRDPDGSPVVTEVKAKGDQHPFYGMVQVLLLAAQLASQAQRSRLATRHGVNAAGPMDVCLVLAANARYFFKPVEGWTRKPKFKPDLTTEAARLCEGFAEDPRSHAYVRSIIWLDAEMAEGRLVFTERRRFEHEAG